MSARRDDAIETTALVVVNAPTPRPPKARRMPIIGAEWEKMPGEPESSYEGLSLYRAMNPAERSLVEVARQRGRHANAIYNAAQTWQWAYRARCWDLHVAANADKALQQALVEKARAVRERQLQVISEQLSIARRGKAAAQLIIDAILAEGQAEGADGKKRPKKLTAAQVSKFAKDLNYAVSALDKSVALERLATGLPTDVTQQAITQKQNTEATLQVVDEMKAIVEEELCDECKRRVARRIERISAQQRAIRARLD